jgi:uncharacterized protein with HEPN domain
MLPDDRDAAHLWSIAQRARYLIRKSGMITLEDLQNDEDHQYAISKALELIGDSVRQLSEDLRTAHPQIPWQKIKRMRDFLAHHYHRADWTIVWTTLTDDIPEMLAVIEPLIESGPPGEAEHKPL